MLCSEVTARRQAAGWASGAGRFATSGRSPLDSRRAAAGDCSFCIPPVRWKYDILTNRPLSGVLTSLGAICIPVPEPVSEPNRCNLEHLKPETPRITPYLVLARGRLILQVVYRGLTDFRLPGRSPKSPSWPTRVNLRKKTTLSIKDICVARGLLSTLAAMIAPCSVKAAGRYLMFCPRFKVTICDLERWMPSASTNVKRNMKSAGNLSALRLTA